MLLDSRPVATISGNETGFDYPKETSVTSLDHLDPDFGSYTASTEPTVTLLVSRLPVILFSQIHDLEPLFYPFGPLKKLQVAGIGLNGTLSVLVQYQSTSAAQEAKEALHGQTYVNNQVEVQFLRPVTTPFDLPLTSRVLSPSEKNCTIKPIPSTNLDVPGTFHSLDSQGISDLPNFDKPSFFATPSFNSAFHDHSGVMFHYAGSRWACTVGQNIKGLNNLCVDGVWIQMPPLNIRYLNAPAATICSPVVNIRIFLLEIASPARYSCFFVFFAFPRVRCLFYNHSYQTTDHLSPLSKCSLSCLKLPLYWYKRERCTLVVWRQISKYRVVTVIITPWTLVIVCLLCFYYNSCSTITIHALSYNTTLFRFEICPDFQCCWQHSPS